MDTRPIGMFDSGCGGLTVLKEYMKLMPNEDFIYYGDTAHLPYGDKSKEKIIEYSEHIVEFLIKKNVKLIVIACGTASAASYDALRKKYHIPIKNIITPIAEKIEDENIGIIATKSTIKSNAWENAILKYHPNSKVTSLACPLFVPIVEEGFAESKLAEYAVHEYISKLKNKNITALVLGCTHYPILSNQIQKEIGKNVTLINAGILSAIDTKEFLNDNQLANAKENKGKHEFFSSDDFEAFKVNAQKLGISLN